MILFLLVLFSASLVIILAGFFLSSKPNDRAQQPTRLTSKGGKPGARSIRQSAAPRTGQYQALPREPQRGAARTGQYPAVKREPQSGARTGQYPIVKREPQSGARTGQYPIVKREPQPIGMRSSQNPVAKRSEATGARTGQYAAVPRQQSQRRPAMSGAMAMTSTRANGSRSLSLTPPTPWKVITIGLISVIILGLYTLSIFTPHDTFLGYNPFADATFTTPTPVVSNLPVSYAASERLTRLGQLDPSQYNSNQEYNTWAYSACSAAAMTEVINSYGHNYRVIDILKVESRIGEITPQLGLLEEIGVARTGAQFGFTTTWGHQLSLDQIIDIANHGRPVIVSWPPDRWAGGHVLVVRGGNAQSVFLADTSRLNYTTQTRARFLQLWGGFSAVMTPKAISK